MLLEQVRKLLRASDADSRMVGPLRMGVTATLRAVAGGEGEGGGGEQGGDEGGGDEGGGGAAAATPAAGGAHLAPALVRFERCRVSVRALRLLELLHEALEDACASDAEGAALLCARARDVLDLWVAVVPAAHAARLELVPHAALLLHNDCLLLAHACLTLGAEYGCALPAPLRTRVTFVDLAPALRRLAAAQLQACHMPPHTSHACGRIKTSLQPASTRHRRGCNPTHSVRSPVHPNCAPSSPFPGRRQSAAGATPRRRLGRVWPRGHRWAGHRRGCSGAHAVSNRCARRAATLLTRVCHRAYSGCNPMVPVRLQPSGAPGCNPLVPQAATLWCPRLQPSGTQPGARDGRGRAAAALPRAACAACAPRTWVGRALPAALSQQLLGALVDAPVRHVVDACLATSRLGGASSP